MLAMINLLIFDDQQSLGFDFIHYSMQHLYNGIVIEMLRIDILDILIRNVHRNRIKYTKINIILHVVVEYTVYIRLIVSIHRLSSDQIQTNFGLV